MLERDLEKRLVRLVRESGGVTYKLDSRSHKGTPDRVVVVPGREAIFVELKTETGKLSALQSHELAKISGAGGVAVVLYGKDQLDRWVIHG